ncbi:response regulator [Suttonella sp. R2A3]|uniref:response regulator n=1 Tax=Suttonella sp. R2A3 TaxID=2908648 RepID=UPI001F1CB2C3|nr:response regulator [Suttonella sp. R2A3]UJF23740.1 response regulator [Suttonella sp. R2A3]
MTIRSALIVDDSALARLTLKRHLQKFNIEVLEAECMVDARYWLWRDELPDVVFMDISMPDIDGFEALAEIRQNSDLRHLPVIMYSGDHSQEAKQRAKDEGATGYLRKPVDTAHLQILLDRLGKIQRKSEQPVPENIAIPEESLYKAPLPETMVVTSPIVDTEEAEQLVQANRSMGATPRSGIKDYAELRSSVDHNNLAMLEQRSQIANLETVAQRQSNDINYLSKTLLEINNRSKTLMVVLLIIAVLAAVGVALAMLR